MDKLELLDESLARFDEMDKESRDKIIETSFFTTLRPKEQLMSGQAGCLGLVIVNSGSLRVFINNNDNREVTLYNLYQYDVCVFSASCVLQDITFNVSIEATEETQILVIPSSTFRKVLKNSLIFSNFFVRAMSQAVSETLHVLNDVTFSSVEKRLASYLIDNNQNDILVTTQEKIANDIGTSREVITRQLKKFEKEGILKVGRGTITILDYNGLDKLSE